MGVLETFYILFKTDADEAAAGVQKLDEAATGAETALEGVDKALVDAAGSAAEVSVGLEGAGAAAAQTAAETARVGREAGEAAAEARKVDTALEGAASSARETRAGLEGAGVAAGRAGRETRRVGVEAERGARGAKGVETGMRGAATGATAAAAATGRLAATTAAADANAKRLAASFLGLARTLAAPLLGLASIGGLQALATGRAAEIRQLDQFSAKLNSTIGDVDAFQQAVVSAGGQSTAALDSLVKIGEKVNEAFADAESGAAKDFATWGLAFKDAEGNALGASDAMLELAGSIEGLSQAEALARIKRLGIEDAATIEVLLRGRRAVEEQIAAQKELGVVTEEQAKIARDYQREVGGLGSRMSRLGNIVMEALLPAMTRGLGGISRAFDWILRNGRLVEGFFIGAAAAVTAYFLPAMTRAAIATIAATWPFLAMGAALAGLGVAFALLYEDVRAFLDGQPSLIGSLVEKYEWFAQVVEGIGHVFRWLGEEWALFVSEAQATWTQLQDIFNQLVEIATTAGATLADIFAPLLDAFGEMAGAVGDIAEAIFGLGTASDDTTGGIRVDFEGIKAVIDAVAPVVRALANVFTTVLGGAVRGVAALVNGLAGAVRGVASAITGVANVATGNIASVTPEEIARANEHRARAGMPLLSTDPAVAAGQVALSRAGSAPQGLAAGGGATTTNQTSNVSVGNVTVNTQATDAAGIARAVRGELNSQLRNTAAGFDDGVAR